MQDFSTSPREMVASFWRNRDLIKTLIRRGVTGRYKGSYFGILWPILIPILMLSIYSFVFIVIFQSRWGSVNSGSQAFYSLILFVGLIAFNFFSECMLASPQIILMNPNYVKKVVFPLEILPVVVVGVAVFHLLLAIAVWLCGYMLFFGAPNFIFLLFPMVIAPLIFMTLGLVYLFSALGVYLRDMPQVMSIFVGAAMFLTPIFYPLSAIPYEYQTFFKLNPLTFSVEDLRRVFLLGELPSANQMLISYFLAILVLCAGFAWFQKTRKGFADVI